MSIKNTLIGLVIFGTGGFIGYKVAEKVLRDQYREDLLDVQEFYYGKLKELGVMHEGFEPDELNKGEETSEEDYEHKRPSHEIFEDVSYEEAFAEFQRVTGMSDIHFKNKNRTSYKSDVPEGGEVKKRPIINYNKPPLEEMVSDIEDEVEIPDIEFDMDDVPIDFLTANAEEFARRRHENQLSGDPYCISHEEYEDGPEGYERHVLYYYSRDRVLCEDDDSMVDDEEVLVGFDYEDVLDMQTMAWVRNDVLLNLYEIHRIDESYAKTVASVVETPKEREFRILARRKQALDD